MEPNLPYLIIPKLIIQPTWGGEYIVKTKGWQNQPQLKNLLIGQSYEIFRGSNLSTLTSSSHPDFQGEITTSKEVEKRTSPPNSVSLGNLIKSSPIQVLGKDVAAKHGPTIQVRKQGI